LPIAGAPETTQVRYVIDPKVSTFVVRAFATGLLSSFGHNPTIAIPDFLNAYAALKPQDLEPTLRERINASALKMPKINVHESDQPASVVLLFDPDELSTQCWAEPRRAPSDGYVALTSNA